MDVHYSTRALTAVNKIRSSQCKLMKCFKLLTFRLNGYILSPEALFQGLLNYEIL